MTDSNNDFGLRALWQSHDVALAPMTLDQIRQRATVFSDGIAKRNRYEYAAIMLVVVVFAFYAMILPEPMLKTGSLLIIAAVLFVAWQLARRTSRAAPDAEAQDVRSYYRARLVREEHMLARIGRWYLAPFVPGLLVFLAGLAKTGTMANPVVFMAVAAFQLLVFGSIWWLNHRAAAALRRQIEQLDLTL